MEHGAEYGRAKRAAEAAGKEIGRGHASALGPAEYFLDQDDRGAAEKAHAESDDERAKPGEDGRTLPVEDEENERTKRNERAAYPQHGANAKAPEAAHADRRADRPSPPHPGKGETADERRLLHHPLHEHRQKRGEANH